MEKYGCFNRAPASPTLRVQSGWYDHPKWVTREPRMINIPDVFANDNECRYDQKKSDERCDGCQHAVPI